ncbi:MAG: hypothetical protein EOP49_26565 [Sphingobacteriales bacterium]|nr:MAG: hypothetical protein EOP49_26565 [Sphingobacteriales bacterium]
MKRSAFCPILCLFCFLLGGCFNVREPEPPETAGGWTSPTETNILLDNLRTAITGLNATNYERCFVPVGYRFIPEPLTPGVASGVFDNWGVQEERIYLTNLKSSTANNNGNSLAFTGKQEIYFNTDSLELTARYNLNLVHQDAAFPHYQFLGSMRMILVRRQNEWYIQSWQDNRLSDSLCWTDLKKYFFAP